MDKVLDRLGLYDFWGIFIPGFISYISLIILISFWGINLEINNVYFLLIGSYLLGTILHEAGHVGSKKILYRKNPEPLYTYLADDDDVFMMYEKNLYKNILRKIMCVDGDIKNEYARYFFNYCYEFLSAQQKSSKADMFESLYGMSRSLWCFYALMLVIGIPFCYMLLKHNHINISLYRVAVAIIASAILAIVSFRRAKRFNECRVKVVLRTFISFQVKKVDDMALGTYTSSE